MLNIENHKNTVLYEEMLLKCKESQTLFKICQHCSKYSHFLNRRRDRLTEPCETRRTTVTIRSFCLMFDNFTTFFVCFRFSNELVPCKLLRKRYIKGRGGVVLRWNRIHCSTSLIQAFRYWGKARRMAQKSSERKNPTCLPPNYSPFASPFAIIPSSHN